MAEWTVRDFMTSQPHRIGAKDTLPAAQKLMTTYRIRHLPVMNSLKPDQVFGILSDRDIKAVSGVVGIDPARIQVGSICHQHPYVVGPDTPMAAVAAGMAERHYGSAIVVERGVLTGILTTVDVCRALTQLLRMRGLDGGG